jgi:5'(3')-deoxyribonucleotidase
MNDAASGPKQILYIDMDNTLVDFRSGIDRIDTRQHADFADRYDEVPGIFALMEPLPGAIEAFHELAEVYDTYILSTAPWLNPSAWQHKIEWVQRHLGEHDGTPAYKRLILSHHKNLNRGDFLVDDRPFHRGADRFEGEVIAFGTDEFPDWPTVTQYLLKRATSAGSVVPVKGDADGGDGAASASSTVQEKPISDLSDTERLEQSARAQSLAVAVHTGQRDKLGVDYIRHPAAISLHFDPIANTVEHCAAWLHDVLEDTAVDARRLRLAGIHPAVIEIVALLTRDSNTSGDDYYRRIAGNAAARAVKYADVTHNTDPDRVAPLDEPTRDRLREKYEHALQVLGLPWPDHAALRASNAWVVGNPQVYGRR